MDVAMQQMHWSRANNKLSKNIHSSQSLKWEFITEQPVYYYNLVPHGMTSGFSIMKYSLNAA